MDKYDINLIGWVLRSGFSEKWTETNFFFSEGKQAEKVKNLLGEEMAKNFEFGESVQGYLCIRPITRAGFEVARCSGPLATVDVDLEDHEVRSVD